MGIKVDRDHGRIVACEPPSIFTDVCAKDYEDLKGLAAKVLIENTKRQLRYMKPEEFADASEDDFLKNFYEPEGNRKITFPEAFWMATKQSGPLFGGTGSLEPGSVFDALLIDGLSDAVRKLTPEQVLERFCYIGTKENIKVRYMNGRMV